MMLIIGALIVLGVIWLLLKRYESRMVLIAAGILMCVIAGKPMASLDAFGQKHDECRPHYLRMFLHGLCTVHEIYWLR